MAETMRRCEGSRGGRRRVVLGAILAGTALVIPLGGACAQPQAGPGAPPPRPIQIGVEMRSSIGSEDPVVNDRHYEDYRLSLGAGDVIQVSMESTEFDGYLELFGAGSQAPLAENDDRAPGSVNPRLVFVAPAAGDYVIRAQDFFEGSGGYTLMVRRGPATRNSMRLVAGRQARGTIGETSSLRVDDAGRPLRYDAYTFEGAAGDRIRLDMSSSNFDSRLELIGTDGTLIDANNDGGRLYDARIVAELPRAGEYTVRALAPADQSGGYSLMLLSVSDAATPNPRPLERGVTVAHELSRERSGVLLREGQRGRIDFFYDLYSLEVIGGETFTVVMAADGFNPVLEAGVWTETLGFAAALADDDNQRDEPARLVVRPRQPGLIHLRVRALGSNTGAYRLRVVEGEMLTATP